MKFIIIILIAVLANSAAAQNKKVIFLADSGKNSKTHAHESGNEILANHLSEKFEYELQNEELLACGGGGGNSPAAKKGHCGSSLTMSRYARLTRSLM